MNSGTANGGISYKLPAAGAAGWGKERRRKREQGRAGGTASSADSGAGRRVLHSPGTPKPRQNARQGQQGEPTGIFLLAQETQLQMDFKCLISA